MDFTENIYAFSAPDRIGVVLPKIDVPLSEFPEQEYLRENLDLPEVSEIDVCRHFTALSKLNFSVDTNFYPLGSCTMKYNPKVNEAATQLSGFNNLHPLAHENDTTGALEMMAKLAEMLKSVGGFSHITLQPAAGAAGEFVGVLMMREYMEKRGEEKRKVLLIPDTAHGTNPASASMCGLATMEVASDERGNVDLDDLRAKVTECGDTLLGLMLTNPNTLGLYEENLQCVTDIIHAAGGLVYGDGANFNALLGVSKPGLMGFDVMHYNLHKTFATPHGGGGPGAGAILVNDTLKDFLPSPIVVRDESGKAIFATPSKSIGQTKLFYGNFGVMLRAYVYMRILGEEGLSEIGKNAVLNANYLQTLLKKWYNIPYGNRCCMHEFVATGDVAEGVHTLDIAKAMIDEGVHPPTIYFPLIVKEAMMIEPTETESLKTLDEFVAVLENIAKMAHEDSDALHVAPKTTAVSRPDEVKAARDMILTFKRERDEEIKS